MIRFFFIYLMCGIGTYAAAKEYYQRCEKREITAFETIGSFIVWPALLTFSLYQVPGKSVECKK